MAELQTRRRRTVVMVQFSLLLALEALFCFTPLGSIPIGPIVATLMMIPVVITGIVMGPKAGALMGFFAGLFSLIVWTFMPPSPAMAFVFSPFYSLGDLHGNIWSLVICFVPRILGGVVAGVSYKSFSRISKNSFVLFGVSGALGSLVNTFGVLGGIYIFFGHQYAVVTETGYNALLSVIGLAIVTNGIPEAIIAGLVATAVCKALRTSMRADGF